MAGYAFVFLNHLLGTPAECKRVCMEFKNALTQAGQEQKEALQVRILLVELGL